jgi:hypothetical protein
MKSLHERAGLPTSAILLYNKKFAKVKLKQRQLARGDIIGRRRCGRGDQRKVVQVHYHLKKPP